MYKVKDFTTTKDFISPNYSFHFNKKNGLFARWGKTKDDDPDFSPFGPEIADIEISSASKKDVDAGKNNMFIHTVDTGCAGNCPFCYKEAWNNQSVHMSLQLFKEIMDKMPKTLTQIAFGVISPAEVHPELWDIFAECRNRDVVPNVTINQVLTDDTAKKFANYCGAVAVSVNENNREVAYNAVKLLSQDNKMSQINFHVVLSEDSVDFIKSVVDDIKTDKRLSRLNALVMLAFKDKGKTGCMSPVTLNAYCKMVEYCEQNEIAFGFDSCSAHVYLQAIKHKVNYKQLEQCVESCESGLFSVYCNVFGEVFACSFCENLGMWKEGLNILNYNSIKELWNSSKMEQWRRKILSCNRECPFYQIGVVNES